MIGLKLLDIIEEIHSRGIIHRDIKPANILIGDEKNMTNIYLVDFGVSRRYFTDRTLRESSPGHLSPRQRYGLIGTARYCSINSHLNIEISRRDDLESLIYVLLSLLKGELDWS